MKKRGYKQAQISMEYLIVVGFVTLIAISLLAVSQFYSRQVTDVVNTNQLNTIARKIIDNAESMFLLGPPSKTTIEVYFPEGIQSVSLSGSEVTFKVRTQAGVTDISYSSDATLAGDIPSTAGFHSLLIEARDNDVLINST